MASKKSVVGIEEWFYRRGYNSTPVKKYMNPDGTATSRVFKLREGDNGELSVDVKSFTTAETAVRDQSKYFLFEISNESVLSVNGLETFHDQLADGTNDAHAVIVGMTMEDEIKPGLLARKSKRVYFVQ